MSLAQQGQSYVVLAKSFKTLETRDYVPTKNSQWIFSVLWFKILTDGIPLFWHSLPSKMDEEQFKLGRLLRFLCFRQHPCSYRFIPDEYKKP